MDVIRWLQRIDRRVLFALVFLAITVPLIRPFPVPVPVAEEARSLYDFIEHLPQGSIALITLDYGPAYKPALHGAAEAIFVHLLRKGHRVALISYSLDGPMMAEQILGSVDLTGKVNGVDYVHLGYRAGGEGGVAMILADFHGVYPVDFYGQPTATMPLMADLKTGNDVSLAIVVSGGGYAGGGWVRQFQQPYGKALACAVTGLMSPSHVPYYQAGQLVGLLSDQLGGAQYETLIQRPGISLAGMGAQTVTHVLIVL